MQINEVVAANVRAIRSERRLSLEAAAGQTGVSKSMLGQIERAEVNPTVSVLARIAEGYHVPLERLLQAPPEAVAVIRSQDLERQRLADGRAFRYSIAQRSQEPFAVERLELQPGVVLRGTLPSGATVCYATVYRGTCVAEVDGQTIELGRWDTLRLTGSAAYVLRNPGDQVVQLHVVTGLQ
jgi:transcriptional regulator with XRE-family HTH domain